MLKDDGDTTENSTLVDDTRVASASQPPALAEPAQPGKGCAPPSPEFLLQILDLVAHPVFAKDRHNRYVVVNRAAAEAVGRSSADMLGKTDADLFPALEAARRRKDDQQTLKGGVAVALPEQWLTNASGELRVLATTKTPLFDSGGQASHVVGVAYDITEKRGLESSLRRVRKESDSKAEQRTEALRRAQRASLKKERSTVLAQLGAGLAHELLNSFGAILNASSILGRQQTPPQEFARALEAIRREVQTSSATIQDLLSHAQVRPPRLYPTSVVSVVSDALNSLDIPESVTVHIDVDVELEFIADAEQMATAVSHLIRNALEAMPTGGELHLRAREVGNAVSIQVRDTGIGIDARAVPYIFDPLVSSKILGLGLGLSSCRLLVGAQEGFVTYLGNEPGATFEIVMPNNVNNASNCQRRVV